MRRATAGCLLVLFFLALAAAPAQAEPAARPTVAVVLGGGAARGIAHVGFLEALEEHGIPVDLIVGTSMGSIVGGLYAAGYSPADLHRIMAEVDYGRLFALRSPPRGGLLSPEPFGAFLDVLLEGKDFAALSRPFYAVATNLTWGEEEVFHEGPVSRAILASMAIPALFPPVQIGTKYYVDGGLRDSVPVAVARNLGADVVIAVNVNQEAGEANYGSLVNILELTLFYVLDGYVQEVEHLADVLVEPEVSYDSYMEYGRVDHFCRKGHEAAERALPEINKAIARVSPDFAYASAPERTPDHSSAELQALVTRAYGQAERAPRPYLFLPLLEPVAGSQAEVGLGLLTTGGGLNTLRETAGYRWVFAERTEDYGYWSTTHPLSPWWTGGVFLKYYPGSGALRPGAAAWSTGPARWRLGVKAEAAPEGHLRWKAEVGRSHSLNDNWTLAWKARAARLAGWELPGGGSPGGEPNPAFASAQGAFVYSPAPDGWPFWAFTMVYPRLEAGVEQVIWIPAESAGGVTQETWLRAGASLEFRVFGFLPLEVHLRTGLALPSRRSSWSLDLGQRVDLP